MERILKIENYYDTTITYSIGYNCSRLSKILGMPDICIGDIIRINNELLIFDSRGKILLKVDARKYQIYTGRISSNYKGNINAIIPLQNRQHTERFKSSFLNLRFLSFTWLFLAIVILTILLTHFFTNK